ncbi:MAG: helix-turn-helix domain-containing protein [Negativicutes bacterium]
MQKTIGQKIRELRLQNKLTLKELGQLTGLSVGYLSQLERGLTDIATDLLSTVAQALGVDRSHFFREPRRSARRILRSYEKEIFQVEASRSIHYHLSHQVDNKILLPRFIELLPINSDEEILSYSHEGEEFIHVLEGVLTLFIDNERQELFPGDSAHYSSTTPHNWANYTTKMMRMLVVSCPNPFQARETKA